MNLISPLERDRYFELFKKEIQGKKFNNVEIIVCPAHIHLESFVENLKSKKVKIGAQDSFWEQEGAYMAATSPSMVKNFGCDYVIIGHSERRKYFGETSEISNKKIREATKIGLKVLYCVGESREERDAGMMDNVIMDQLQEGLKEITPVKMEKIVIVYEPVWSVGSDIMPTSNEAMEARIFIRKILIEKYGAKNAEKVPILYGGSIKSSNADQVCVSPGMGGGLVGRESLDPHEFIKIAEILNANGSK